MRNIPNILSISRLFLIPLGLYLFHNGRFATATVVFAIGFLTDFFDGILARKFGWVSNFGRFADPVCDFISITAIYVYLMFFVDFGSAVSIVLKPILMLIIMRYLFLFYLLAGLIRKGIAVESAHVNDFGKVSASLQMIALTVFFLSQVVQVNELTYIYCLLFFFAFWIGLFSSIEYGRKGYELGVLLPGQKTLT